MKESECEKYCLFAIDVLYSYLKKIDRIYEMDNIDIEW